MKSQSVRLIHQIDAHHHLSSELQHLKGQDQTAFQAGGVTYHHHRVRLTAFNKVPGYRLFLGVGGQRIRTG